MSPDLQAELATATRIGRDAAELALSWFHRGVEWIEKDPGDLVSVADRETESLIADRLACSFPDDLVIGEEGTGAGRTPKPGQRRWYVDPIDGTTNFLKGLPTWGISIGLADGDDELLLGVVILPATGSVFTAARGLGATRNGVPIRCQDTTDLGRTLVTYAITGTGSQHFGGDAAMMAGFRALTRRTLGTRMQGCSVADLTCMAEGTIDASMAGGMNAWDVAAGLIIAREAGVTVTTLEGEEATGPATVYVASPPGVHAELRTILADHGALPNP
ncbi:inositol monophosphatase family protein [Euzebya tangerina]|uniref:inositol monophosphatase family protein n=1 Tax=Euzebya tangerina TaxID=591198 RepID=UPI0013C333E1|nr:inositol monophosphatase [Euzebya tangerina]